MTENNRFYKGEYTNCRYDICEIEKDGEIVCTVGLEDADFIIGILEENKELEEYKKRVEKLFKVAYNDTVLSKKTQHSLEVMADLLEIDLNTR